LCFSWLSTFGLFLRRAFCLPTSALCFFCAVRRTGYFTLMIRVFHTERPHFRLPTRIDSILFPSTGRRNVVSCAYSGWEHQSGSHVSTADIRWFFFVWQQLTALHADFENAVTCELLLCNFGAWFPGFDSQWNFLLVMCINLFHAAGKIAGFWHSCSANYSKGRTQGLRWIRVDL
jgi:hypothetical protein